MNKKIVIVDDEVHIRALIEQTLEDLEDDHDVELFTASNGQEGLDLITEEKPDLVFLDVMMPLMNGYDVCKNVMQNPELGHVKIVLLTAKGQEADRERGLSSGATEYMTKPFDPDDLLDYAKRVLGLED
jgi:two-component system alkaline phosphatase synthesis response regulator PhoP